MPLNDCCRQPVAGSALVLKDPDGGRSAFRMTISPAEVANVRVYKVDNCQITNGLRCDYLVLPNAEAAVFVELKGGDVEKGIAQLSTTMKVLKVETAGMRRYAVLVPTRCPLPPYQVQKALDVFRRSLKCRLRIDNVLHTCRASDF